MVLKFIELNSRYEGGELWGLWDNYAQKFQFRGCKRYLENIVSLFGKQLPQ
jgi:hypothetical protein